MPPISGCTKRSNASVPSRRRANEARLSSPSDFRGGTKYSLSNRSLPQGLSTPDSKHRPDPLRDHEHESRAARGAAARGARRRLCRRLRIGWQQIVRQSKLAAKLHRPRNIGDEIVGSALDQETVTMHGRQDAAGPIPGFQQQQLGRGVELTGMHGRRKPVTPPPTMAIRRLERADDVTVADAGRTKAIAGNERRSAKRREDCRATRPSATLRSRTPNRITAAVAGQVAARISAIGGRDPPLLGSFHRRRASRRGTRAPVEDPPASISPRSTPR